MITKVDAINIGKAIVAGANHEKDMCNKSEHYHINGALGYALDNLWYNVFSAKLREAFGFDKDYFYKTVWKLK